VLLGAFLGLTVAASAAYADTDVEPTTPAAPTAPATPRLPAQPKAPAALAAPEPAPPAVVAPAADPPDPTPPTDPTSTTTTTTTTPPPTTPTTLPDLEPPDIGSASSFAAPEPLSVAGQRSRRTSRSRVGRVSGAGVGQLPFTGSGTLLVLVAGLGALAIGAGAVWWGTRSRPGVDASSSSSTG
jgi:hypothetical protein